MKAILRNSWEALARQEGPSISLYLPVHPHDWSDQGDLPRLNQLLERAEVQLKSQGVDENQVRALANQIQALPKSAEWKTRRSTIAAFISAAMTRIFWLNVPVEPAAWGDNHFHVRPLLPLVVESDDFLLLKLSENHCSFYLGNAIALTSLEINDLPAALSEAREAHRGEQELQVHSMRVGGLGRRGAIFHGHGGQADLVKAERQAYLQQIATAVERRFPQMEMPLMVAAVEKNFAEWQAATAYPRKLQVLLPGNHDQTTDHELHDRAWQAAAPVRHYAAIASYQQYQNARGSGRVRTGLGDVITAARNGQVAALFVDSRSPIPGRYDAQTEAVQIADRTAAEDQSDLIELAVREAVLHRGRVYAVEQLSPTPALAEALLRY